HPGHGAHQFPPGRARHPLRRDLRLHAVVERVPVRTGVPVVTAAEDDPDRRLHRARPRRRLLLGPAHGRRAARLDPRRPRLLVLRRALRHRVDGCRERLASPLFPVAPPPTFGPAVSPCILSRARCRTLATRRGGRGDALPSLPPREWCRRGVLWRMCCPSRGSPVPPCPYAQTPHRT